MSGPWIASPKTVLSIFSSSLAWIFSLVSYS